VLRSPLQISFRSDPCEVRSEVRNERLPFFSYCPRPLLSTHSSYFWPSGVVPLKVCNLMAR
jgi:hypothetical protein